MPEGATTIPSGVSGNIGFTFNSVVATLGEQQQAIKGGDDKEGYTLVATDEVSMAFSKDAIRNGDFAQIPAKDGNNPEKDKDADKKSVIEDKDDNTRN